MEQITEDNVEITQEQIGYSTIVTPEEITEPIPLHSEQFCTNWKCITKKVKLVTLKGSDVIVSSLNERVA